MGGSLKGVLSVVLCGNWFSGCLYGRKRFQAASAYPHQGSLKKTKKGQIHNLPLLTAVYHFSPLFLRLAFPRQI